MRKFRPYPFYKVYLEDYVFLDSLELKIGYLNINDLTAEYHAEYINSDRNLSKLDILAILTQDWMKNNHMNSGLKS